MSLGASGPPATPKQLQYLKALLEKAGHPTWRDARRPLGLTQRQGSGKFTRREASELIDRLLAADNGESDEEAGGVTGARFTAAVAEVSAPVLLDEADARMDILRGVPADALANELRRRGWTATPPDAD